MPRLPVRCLLFFSSYFPLSLIYCFVLFEKHRNWAIVSLLIGLISLIGLYLYFWFIAPKKTAFHEKIIDFHRHDGDIMSYIASYIVPFISISLDGWVQLLSVGVFIFVLLILYVSSNMIYINPMLNVFGYHLYEVTFEGSELSYYFITRHNVVRKKIIQVLRIGEEAFLEKRELTVW